MRSATTQPSLNGITAQATIASTSEVIGASDVVGPDSWKRYLYPPKASVFNPNENVICGNVSFYGATAGKAFILGPAGERFCVRNSGAWAVVEGVGDHGCEYMTGGRAVILGPTGRNFAAGMSGGIAYVWDIRRDFNIKCNLGMVSLEKVVAEGDIAELLEMVALHHQVTSSSVAERLLNDWSKSIRQFVKVMPIDYRKALERMQAAEQRHRIVAEYLPRGPPVLAHAGSNTMNYAVVWASVPRRFAVLVATNAGGVSVLRYGNARDLCLGLEVVLADGQIWNGLNTLRKNNTGLDLRDLFVGAEGSLGVITGAVLKLFPKPRDQQTALVALEEAADGI